MHQSLIPRNIALVLYVFKHRKWIKVVLSHFRNENTKNWTFFVEINANFTYENVQVINEWHCSCIHPLIENAIFIITPNIVKNQCINIENVIKWSKRGIDSFCSEGDHCLEMQQHDDLFGLVGPANQLIFHQPPIDSTIFVNH